MVLGTGSTLKQPFTSTVEDYNFTRLPIKDPDEPRKKIPVGREGRPEELGPLVVYLASSVSDFMTGETIFIDGGELAKL